MKEYDVFIIGSGIAGLNLAYHLEKKGLSACILEKNQFAGGRLRSEYQNGFCFDYGFHTIFSSYPELSNTFTSEELNLSKFNKGLRFFNGDELFLLSTNTGDLLEFVSFATSRSGEFRDILGYNKLRDKLLTSKARMHSEMLKTTTAFDFLKKEQFSSALLEDLFKPWIRAITLRDDTLTSAYFFAFLFQVMHLGDLSIPSHGIGSLTKTLLGKLKNSDIIFEKEVSEVKENGSLILSDGEELASKKTVIATDPISANRILGRTSDVSMSGAEVFYFKSAQSLYSEPVLMLNSNKVRSFNHLCQLNNISKNLAPKDVNFVSVTSLFNESDKRPEKDKLKAIRKEISSIFNSDPDELEFLKSYRIPRGLTHKNAGEKNSDHFFHQLNKQVYLLSEEFGHTSSIQNALKNSRKLSETLFS